MNDGPAQLQKRLHENWRQTQMIPTIIEAILRRRILGKGHDSKQAIFQQLLEPHNPIPHSDNLGHFPRLGPEVITVIPDDAIVDGIDP